MGKGGVSALAMCGVTPQCRPSTGARCVLMIHGVLGGGGKRTDLGQGVVVEAVQKPMQIGRGNHAWVRKCAN